MIRSTMLIVQFLLVFCAAGRHLVNAEKGKPARAWYLPANAERILSEILEKKTTTPISIFLS